MSYFNEENANKEKTLILPHFPIYHVTKKINELILNEK